MQVKFLLTLSKAESDSLLRWVPIQWERLKIFSARMQIPTQKSIREKCDLYDIEQKNGKSIKQPNNTESHNGLQQTKTRNRKLDT